MVLLPQMVDSFWKSSKRANDRRHIVELDGWRGIAALAVFFHHISATSIDRSWNSPTGSFYEVSSYGIYGVDLFFVLSGYLITTILLRDQNSDHYYHNFYWKRALRVLPLYFVTLLVAWIWFRASIGGILASVLFVANFSSLLHVSLTGPYWTLAIEEQFYLIWPQFVRRLNLDRLRTIAWCIVLAEPILRLVETAFHHYNFYLTLFHCDGLALGALLACQLYKQDKKSSAVHGVPKAMSGIWAIVLGCIFLAATRSFFHSPRFFMQAIAVSLSAVGLCFYGCLRISIEHSGSRYLAILRSSVLIFFGEISYCMYMSHTYVISEYDRLRGPLSSGDKTGYWVRVVIVLGVVIAISVISRYALELPFMSLRRYVLRGPKRMEQEKEAVSS